MSMKRRVVKKLSHNCLTKIISNFKN